MNLNPNRVTPKTNLKTLAELFVNDGCIIIFDCKYCPHFNPANKNKDRRRCKLKNESNRQVSGILISKQWAVDYLEKIKKLEFLDSL